MHSAGCSFFSNVYSDQGNLKQWSYIYLRKPNWNMCLCCWCSFSVLIFDTCLKFENYFTLRLNLEKSEACRIGSSTITFFKTYPTKQTQKENHQKSFEDVSARAIKHQLTFDSSLISWCVFWWFTGITLKDNALTFTLNTHTHII